MRWVLGGSLLTALLWCGWLAYRALAVVAPNALWKGLGASALMEIPRVALLLHGGLTAGSSGLAF